jgi:peptidoglycan-N-acetylglucosamine deacetylase
MRIMIYNIATILFTIFTLKTIIIVLFFILKKRQKLEKSTSSENFRPITVIIPAFNEEIGIGNTLHSVLQSDYNFVANVDIVVIDDGSSDETANIVNSYRKIYKNKISLIKVQNGGKARALNFGIRYAEDSDFVMCIDADSVIERSAIKNAMKNFIDKNIGAVAGVVYPSRNTSFLQKMQTIEYNFGQKVEKKFQEFFNSVLVIPGAVGIFRKTAIMQSGYYKTDTLTEDMDLTISILESGWKVLVDTTCISYTEVPNSLSELIKQRVRWMMGTLQTLWKHRNLTFTKGNFFFIFFYTWIFGILTALLFPLILLLFAFLFLSSPKIFIFYFALSALIEIIIQSFTGSFSLLSPVQRLFYSFINFYVLLKSFQNLKLKNLSWNRLKRYGV